MHDLLNNCFLKFALLVLVLIGCQSSRNNPEKEKFIVDQILYKEDSVKPVVLNEDDIDVEIGNDLWGLEPDNNLKIKTNIIQVRLAISNAIGVPHYTDEVGIFLFGFDVDNKGNFYFMGGEDKGILAKFRGSRLLYRKEFKDWNPSSIHNINDTTLISLNRMSTKNELFWIDSRSGSLIASFGQIIKNIVNTCVYTDSTITIEAFDAADTINRIPKLVAIQFDIKGSVLNVVENIQDVPSEIIHIGVGNDGVGSNSVLGIWKGLFVKVVEHQSKYNIYLIDEQANIVNYYPINANELGTYDFFGSPNEYDKMVNGKLYALKHDGNNAIVSIIDLQEIFALQGQ